MKPNKGFMMVEILVAISIITVSILAAMSVTGKSIYIARESLHQAQAALLLEEGAEAVRIVRDNAWNNISGLDITKDYYPVFSGGTWTLSLIPSDVGIFTRKINVSTVYRNLEDNISAVGTSDNGTKKVIVTVSWNEGGQVITKILSFYISDIFS
ncbi:MAG: hypothetical protein WAV10_00690 [Minisyncoccia bacterium]